MIFNFLNLLLISYVSAENSYNNYKLNEYDESDLRDEIFMGYDKKVIPVKDNDYAVELLYGISIESLVFFDQKAEKIKFNTLTTLVWKDEYLRWDNEKSHNHHSHNPDFIVIPNYLLWQPDLELYNSGSLPLVFEKSSVSKLYSNGLIVYNRPTSYTFSCKLNLDDFPFDTQECTLLFGSWKYPKAILNLRPFTTIELLSVFQEDLNRQEAINLNFNLNSNVSVNTSMVMDNNMNTDINMSMDVIMNTNMDLNMDGTMNMNMNNFNLTIPEYLTDLQNIKNLSISPKFSHNEWKITEYSVGHEDIEYKCCPGDLWPNSTFKIKLQRNPNKYVIMIIMAIFITISSLVVNLLPVSLYRRTYISVFIPLTLIWLQIHSSSKIPVIDTPTKLEKIIQLCFYTTMICAIESGIIYTILINNVGIVSDFFKKEDINKIDVKIRHKELTPINKLSHENENILMTRVTQFVYNFDIYFRIIMAVIYVIFITVFV